MLMELAIDYKPITLQGWKGLEIIRFYVLIYKKTESKERKLLWNEAHLH